MLFHNCPACDSTGSSRRQFLAGIGAAGLAAGLACALLPCCAGALVANRTEVPSASSVVNFMLMI